MPGYPTRKLLLGGPDTLTKAGALFMLLLVLSAAGGRGVQSAPKTGRGFFDEGDDAAGLPTHEGRRRAGLAASNCP